MKELEAIKARAEAASEGPWVAFNGDHFAAGITSGSSTLTWDDHGGEVFKPVDADFIAHARTDIPKLIAALEATLEMASNPGDVVGWRGAPDDLANFAYAIQSAITEALA